MVHYVDVRNEKCKFHPDICIGIEYMKYTKHNIWRFIIMATLLAISYAIYKKMHLESFDQADYNNQTILQSITHYLSNTKSDREQLNIIYKKLQYYKKILKNPTNYLSINAKNNDTDNFNITISCNIGSQEVTILYPTGEKGEQGALGPNGPSGSQGPSGETGPPGQQGTYQSYFPY